MSHLSVRRGGGGVFSRLPRRGRRLHAQVVMNTSLCGLLGIDVPIISAPFGPWNSVRLAAAVAGRRRARQPWHRGPPGPGAAGTVG